MEKIIWFIPLTGLAGLLFMYLKSKWVTKQDAAQKKCNGLQDIFRKVLWHF
jgi:hypothetical protein